jgi:pimeloyl-ACP methyl ester carboxylesterase
MMAAMPNSPIKRLILNDVGPFVGASALAGIREYAASNPTFATFEEAREFFKTRYAQFVSHDKPDYWDHITRYSTQQQADGTFTLLCDPAVAQSVPGVPALDVDLWALWDKITCPVFVIRGKNSQVLEADTLQEMKKRQPHIDIYEVDDVGHAPSLAERRQIVRVYEWLMSH